MTDKHDEVAALEQVSVARRRFLGTTARGALLALGAPALAFEGAAEAYGATQQPQHPG